MATTSHKAYRKKESHGGALLKAPPGFQKNFSWVFLCIISAAYAFHDKNLTKKRAINKSDKLNLSFFRST